MPFLNRPREILLSSGAKEASYGTAADVDSLHKFENATFLRPDHTVINDLDQLGGFEEATEQKIVAKAYSAAINTPRVKPHTLATILAYGLGDLTTTMPTGATATRKHRAVTLVGTTELPSFTIEEKKTASIQRRFRGCGVTDFTLQVTRQANRIMSLNTNILMGIFENGNGEASEIVEPFINGGNSAIWLFPGSTFKGITGDDLDLATPDLTGASVNKITSDVNLMSWGFNNNVNRDSLYTLDSGDYFGVFERAAPTHDLRLDFDLETDTVLADFEGQTPFALQWKIRGPVIEAGFYYGVNIIFPRLQYASYTPGEDSGRQTENTTILVMKESEEIAIATDTDGATDAAGTELTSVAGSFASGADRVLIGDNVTIDDVTAKVTAVSSDTVLEVDSTLGASLSAQTYVVTRDPLPSVIIDVFNEQTAYAA